MTRTELVRSLRFRRSVAEFMEWVSRHPDVSEVEIVRHNGGWRAYVRDGKSRSWPGYAKGPMAALMRAARAWRDAEAQR